MSSRADSIPIVSQATYTSSGTSGHYAVGEYRAGTIYVYIRGLSGTGPRVLPRWQISPNAGHGATSGYWMTQKSYATSIAATGLSMITLPGFARWGRLNYTVRGTGPNVNFSAWFVGQASY